MEVSEPTFGNALFDMAATDIDEESDGDDIVFSLAATDNSLVCMYVLSTNSDCKITSIMTIDSYTASLPSYSSARCFFP